MKIGSEFHKELFCQSFIKSHREYEPEHLPWPDLDNATLDRLRGIPFWDEALNTERQAGAMLSAFAATVNDPLLRDAITLQGMEESRHARLIGTLVKQYGLKATDHPTPELFDSSEPAFTRFGYGECFDSFFAFGLFEIARQSGFVPESLLAIFDPILDEEARHMVFFVNWVAYQQVNQGRGPRLLRGVHSLWHYSGSLRRRLDTLRSSNGKASSGKGFTASGASAVSINLTPERFLSTCLQENTQRMSRYDPRLLRPQVMPAIASIALRSFKVLPKRSGKSSEH